MMGKRSKKDKAIIVSPATEVDVDIKVSIQEIHSRTSVVCDKCVRTFSFSMGDDFEKVLDWLMSDDAHTQFGDLCVEARVAMGSDRGGAK